MTTALSVAERVSGCRLGSERRRYLPVSRSKTAAALVRVLRPTAVVAAVANIFWICILTVVRADR
jgi:hypothetical protein